MEFMFSKQRKESNDFIAKKAKEKDVKALGGGLLYKVIEPGQGTDRVSATDSIRVKYEGKLVNGTVFDSSERAKDAEKDLLTGFSAGGDDYICKPFSLHEVLARISAVLRRSGTEVSKPKTLTSEGLTIDFERKAAYVEGMEVRLSPKEFGILSLMVRQPGRVFSRDEILAAVWRGTNCIVIDRTIDVHIARLRRKLGAVGLRLTNRPGYGYCFE